jgi:hypothetical protein
MIRSPNHPCSVKSTHAGAPAAGRTRPLAKALFDRVPPDQGRMRHEVAASQAPGLRHLLHEWRGSVCRALDQLPPRAAGLPPLLPRGHTRGRVTPSLDALPITSRLQTRGRLWRLDRTRNKSTRGKTGEMSKRATMSMQKAWCPAIVASIDCNSPWHPPRGIRSSRSGCPR